MGEEPRGSVRWLPRVPTDVDMTATDVGTVTGLGTACGGNNKESTQESVTVVFDAALVADNSPLGVSNIKPLVRMDGVSVGVRTVVVGARGGVDVDVPVICTIGCVWPGCGCVTGTGASKYPSLTFQRRHDSSTAPVPFAPLPKQELQRHNDQASQRLTRVKQVARHVVMGQASMDSESKQVKLCKQA